MSNRTFYLENTNPNPKSKKGENHNKFYRMIELDNGKFLSEWGTIGKTPLGTQEYSMTNWHFIQTKKQRGGYVFATDLGNTTYTSPQSINPTSEPASKFSPKKVSSVKLRIRMVIELLNNVVPENCYDEYKRVQEIYLDFSENPETFTKEIIKELNEIYNKYRVDKD